LDKLRASGETCPNPRIWLSVLPPIPIKNPR
jgi:hypothetical protein